MKLSEGVTQVRHRDFSARRSRQQRTNFQLEGFWLHVVRGAWISFVLVELLVLILTLVATRGQGLTICPFIVSCAVTEASAQALHQLQLPLRAMPPTIWCWGCCNRWSFSV